MPGSSSKDVSCSPGTVTPDALPCHHVQYTAYIAKPVHAVYSTHMSRNATSQVARTEKVLFSFPTTDFTSQSKELTSHGLNLRLCQASSTAQINARTTLFGRVPLLFDSIASDIVLLQCNLALHCMYVKSIQVSFPSRSAHEPRTRHLHQLVTIHPFTHSSFHSPMPCPFPLPASNTRRMKKRKTPEEEAAKVRSQVRLILPAVLSKQVAYHQSDPFSQPQLPSNLRSLPATAHGSLPSLCSPLFFLIPLFLPPSFQTPHVAFLPHVQSVGSALSSVVVVAPVPSPGHSYQPPPGQSPALARQAAPGLYHVGGFSFTQ